MTEDRFPSDEELSNRAYAMQALYEGYEKIAQLRLELLIEVAERWPGEISKDDINEAGRDWKRAQAVAETARGVVRHIEAKKRNG